jgi:hypothetical protein
MVNQRVGEMISFYSEGQSIGRRVCLVIVVGRRWGSVVAFPSPREVARLQTVCTSRSREKWLACKRYVPAVESGVAVLFRG